MLSDAPYAMIYPDMREDEERVPKIRKDILLSKGETNYFPLDFRMRNVVIDLIALKYDRTIEQYPEPDADETVISAHLYALLLKWRDKLGEDTKLIQYDTQY